MPAEKKNISRYRIRLIGVLIGALAGWTYYYFVGCRSGTCPISSHPLNSTLYGALTGLIATSGSKKKNTKQ